MVALWSPEHASDQVDEVGWQSQPKGVRCERLCLYDGHRACARHVACFFHEGRRKLWGLTCETQTHK